jgi:hypothetical protein
MIDDAEELGESTVLHITDKALLCKVDGIGEQWIPKSVVHDASEVYDGMEGDVGVLVVKAWWARKAGLV